MLSTDSAQTLIGTAAYGPDGERIGTVGQVYLGNDSGAPEWATIKTGFFGTKESFVPLSDADLTADGLQLPYDKDRIKSAPNIDADRDISVEEETTLYEYYGLPADQTGRTRPDTGDDGGRDTSGPTTDDAMTRSEERVHAGTHKRETGRARLRKYVVTEQQQMTVPVTHEEVRVEREPITEENRDRAMSGSELSDEEHEVVLTEEQAVIHKETVPVERVRIGKDQITDDEDVTVDVRSEQIDTDVDAGRTSRRD